MTNHRSPIQCIKGIKFHDSLESIRSFETVIFSILKKDYITKNGEIKTLNFRRNPKAQEDYINNKVNESTHGMIDHVVEGLDDSTLSVIISGKIRYFLKGRLIYYLAMFYENTWPESLQWKKPTVSEQKSEAGFQSP